MPRLRRPRRVSVLMILLAGGAIVLWPARRFVVPRGPQVAMSVSRVKNGVVAKSESGEAMRSSSRPMYAAAAMNPDEMPTSALAAIVAERLREWEDQDDPNQRDQRGREVEALLTGPRRLEIIAALPPRLMNFACGLPWLQQWMATEPEAAAEWLSSHPDVSAARLLTLLQHWTEHDPVAVELYLRGLPAGEWREQALAAAGNLAVSLEPAAAIAWAAQMSPDGRRTGLLQRATETWAKQDPARATEWVTHVSDAELRQHLSAALAVSYAGIDPVLAAQWAIRVVPAGADLDRTIAEIARAWAEYEPSAVAQWVARFPDGTGRQLALGSLVNVWGNRDRGAVTAWLQRLPDETLRVQAENLLTALPEKFGRSD